VKIVKIGTSPEDFPVLARIPDLGKSESISHRSMGQWEEQWCGILMGCSLVNPVMIALDMDKKVAVMFWDAIGAGCLIWTMAMRFRWIRTGRLICGWLLLMPKM
jgi:hypothetical protein